MRSTSGQHFIGLDHLRALAALLVVTWHFIPVGLYPPDAAPSVIPLALFDEGHTGVSLFMVLSGYLFAKLLDGRRILFRPFVRNRVLRLAPLLLVVCAYQWSKSPDAVRFLGDLARGFVLPTWPNGGWSIAIELQFYLLLPVILVLGRRTPWAVVAVVAAALALRMGVHLGRGNVQDFAYWTLGGRIDQFAAGMLAWRFRASFVGRGRTVGMLFAAFALAWWVFDRAGGFYGTRDSIAWVFIPMAEALAWSALVAWYDGRTANAQSPPSRLSRAVAFYGDVSYSIYLLHFFWVFKAARDLGETGFPMTNVYALMAAAFGFFLLMGVPAWITNRCIERPFMRWRRPYAVPLAPPAPAATQRPALEY